MVIFTCAIRTGGVGEGFGGMVWTVLESESSRTGVVSFNFDTFSLPRDSSDSSECKAAAETNPAGWPGSLQQRQQTDWLTD